jgi:transglutaminase-like putative cysteine protease
MPGAGRRKLKHTPEDSKVLRVVVLAITVLSVAALAVVGAVDPVTAAASFVLVPFGSWLSYRRRGNSNTILKLCIAVALLAALLAFLARVRHARSVDEARFTLGGLFVWVQVLHSFDLPRRRDLAFSVFASVALMAEAGTLSLDAQFGLLLIPYVALVALWLFLSDRARGLEEAGPAPIVRRAAPQGRAPLGGAARPVAATLAAVTLASAAVFLATPRLPGTRVIAPPFSLAHRVGIPGFSGAVVNPDLPSRAGGGEATGARGAGYPVFGSEVDLRVRGVLSDRLVMRVRAPQAAFWRGQAYDTFDGTAWTAPHAGFTRIGRSYGRSIVIPPDGSGTGGLVAGAPSRTVVQTFFVVRRQPNIIFAAFRPREVYFPASVVAVDPFSSIRSPILLEPGTVYSVVSDVPVTSPEMLRAAPPSWPRQIRDEYTQLPSDLPSRVVSLAHRITDRASTTYDKVMAVQRWLHVHTRYRLDIPPDPPGVDAVDYFLFERRQGYCEHIASAMAVLLRAVGIPTRFAVGFGPGAHNLLTGYYDVRESDAHAWVEVAYQGVGWLNYDPTFGVPDAAPGLSATFIAPEVFAAIGRFFARVVPGPVKDAVRALGSTMAGAARTLAAAWPVAAGSAILAAAGWVMIRRRRRKRRDPPPIGAAAAFASLCRTFERRGRPRAPHHTPSEHLEALLATDDVARESREDVERIVRTFERERFAARPPAEHEVAASLAAAARLRDRTP